MMEEIDPFLSEGDVVNELGNSRSRAVVEMKTTKEFGMRKSEPKKGLLEGLWSAQDDGAGETRATRAKVRPVSHMNRAKDFFKAQGWEVLIVETWKVSRGGAQYRCDKWGIFDLELTKVGMKGYAQVCGKHADRLEHLRKMTSSKKAPDNRRPRLTNLVNTLLRGELVYIIGFEIQENGRYAPVLWEVTAEMVAEALGRKRK